MSRRLTGKDINVFIGYMIIHVDEVSVSIEDNTAVAKTRGQPNGYTTGDVSASGEIKVDTTNFNLILAAAKAAGSFQSLSAFDFVFNGATPTDILNIEAFECKLRISDLLSAKSTGGEQVMHTLPFDVTGKDFIRINGVPYIDTLLAETFIL